MGYFEVEREMSKSPWKRGTCEESVLAVIEIGVPMMVKDIAEASGITVTSAGEALKRLREKKLAHIADWALVDLWHQAAVWVAGEGKDAPRRTNTERNYALENAKRAQLLDDLVEENLARERAAKLREALSRPVFRHPQDVAFFGPASLDASTTGARDEVTA